MLSPAMLQHSLTRRRSIKDKRRSTMQQVQGDLLTVEEESDGRRGRTGRRRSAPNIEEMNNKTGSQSPARDLDGIDALIGDCQAGNGLMLIPNDREHPLTRAVEDLALFNGKTKSSVTNRRASLIGGNFDHSPPSRNKAGRRDSNVPSSLNQGGGQISGRRDTLHEHEIFPHQYTDTPTVAWEMLKTKRPVKLVRQMKMDTPIRPDHVRFVCVACLHGLQLDPASVPPGDVLIVAGDFSSCGLPKEIKAFNENMGQFKHTYKIVIAGNHECTFDEGFLRSTSRDPSDAKEAALKQALLASLVSSKIGNPKSLLSNVVYLQDSMVELFGLRIYGTPWQPRFDNWAFNIARGQAILDKWNQIPTGIDVLITHTPPLGHGDMLSTGDRAGCVELLNSVCKRIRPKYHVFGHIHEGYGCTSDGYTKFINCCLTNNHLEMVNNPVIFDVPVNADTKSLYVQNSKKMMKKINKK